MPHSKAKLDLNAQLASYVAVKPENWSAHLRRWPIYAAATGAALAMATSADAGIISGYSGASMTIPVQPSGLETAAASFFIDGHLVQLGGI